MRNSKGVGIIEVLIAAGILAIVALGISVFITSNVQTSIQLNEKSTCHQVANALLANLTSIDNSSTIRNFLPTGAGPFLAPPDANDPFCTVAGTPQCDRINHYNANVITKSTPLYHSQNIRNAATWAMAMYNSGVAPQICTGTGMRFTQGAAQGLTDLNNIMPGNFTFPSTVQNIDLLIQPIAVGGGANPTCDANPLQVNTKSGIAFNVQFTVQFQNAANQVSSACNAKSIVRYPQDTIPAQITRLDVYRTTASGPSIIAPNVVESDPPPQRYPFSPTVPPDPIQGDSLYCSCTIQNGCAAAQTNNIRVEVEANEPGVTFFCRKRLPVAESIGANQMVYCGALGTITLNSATISTVSAPAPTTATITFTEADDNFHEIEVYAVDVGGNLSDPMVAQFRPRGAACGPPACNPKTDGCGMTCPGIPPMTGCTGCGGSDVCGRPCPPCPPPPPANPGCTPNCPISQCGQPDGCGGTCGACASGGGGCTPDCPTSKCGQPDGCGGTCASCETDQQPPAGCNPPFYPDYYSCMDARSWDNGPVGNMDCEQVSGCWQYRCTHSKPICCVCVCHGGNPINGCE